jgi:hypothetical protein
LKILHPICLKFAVIFLLFYTAAWSRQRPLSCWSWHGRNDFRLLINRTWKLLAKVFKWSAIVCLLLLTVMKNHEKYECGSLRVKISKCGRFYTPALKRTSKREIYGISSFVWETPAQNGRVGRYVTYWYQQGVGKLKFVYVVINVKYLTIFLEKKGVDNMLAILAKAHIFLWAL